MLEGLETLRPIGTHIERENDREHLVKLMILGESRLRHLLKSRDEEMSPLFVPQVRVQNVVQTVEKTVQTTVNTTIQAVVQANIDLIGERDGRRIFSTPDYFSPNTIVVTHNGRMLSKGYDADYIVEESAGDGAGYDTVKFLRIIPSSSSELKTGYVAKED